MIQSLISFVFLEDLKGARFDEQDELWKKKDLLDDDRSTFRFSCENWKFLQPFNDAFLLIFVLEPDKTMSQLNFSLAELTLWSSWKTRIHKMSLFCHLPPSTGPNTCIQTPAAQPINHCLLIEEKVCWRSLVQMSTAVGPVYFGRVLFDNWMSVMKGETHQAEMKTRVLHCLNGSG